MFDGRWRTTVDRATRPAGRRLQQWGVSADVLTATGLISATATAVAIGTGHFAIAIVLLVVTGLHDLLDGPVAKASGTASVRGAFFDSVTDRVADALLLGGVAWYLEGHDPGHLVLLPFAVLAAATLVSYVRAKAESLGLSAKGGLMERAERMILLGIGLLSSILLVPVLWTMLALTAATAAGRFAKVWRAAEAPVQTRRARAHVARTRATVRRRRRQASGRASSRWRLRRHSGSSVRPARAWRSGSTRSSLRSRAVARRSG
ncbi:MAG: CDP-alcohol phosphatidyltransferase family protein [Acidimicrobiales bacterium]